MKKNLCLLLVCLLSAAAPLQAQDMQQAQKLIDQAQKYLREREFAPIKNLHGVDSLDSARELMKGCGIEL